MPRALWEDPYAAQTINLLQEPARARAAAVAKIGEAQARAAEIAGQAQANAQIQSGNAWSGAINNAAGAIASVPGQIEAARARSQQDALRQLQLSQAQRLDAGQRTMAGAMQTSADPSMQPQGPDQNTANGVVPQTPSFLKPDENGVHTWDIEGISKYMASKGFGDLNPTFMKDVGGLNDALRQESTARTATLRNVADIYLRSNKNAEIANKLVDTLQANKFYSDDALARVRSQIGTPQFDQMAEALATPEKVIEVAKGGIATTQRRAEQNLPPLVTNAEPDKPPVPEFKPPEGIGVTTPSGLPASFDIRTGKWSDPSTGKVLGPGEITSASAKQPVSKPGTVEDWVERARRLAVQQNGGAALTDAQMQSVDTKALQSFKETNADPELRAAALAQRNISQLLAQSQLNQTPTKEQAASVADDLVNHRIAPEQLVSLFSTRGKEGLAFKLAVTSEAKKLDPNFNFEQASADYGFSKSAGFQQTTRLLGSVLESMPRLEANATKVGNGNFRTWNQLSNAAASQFNDTDLKRLKTDALLVGDEVAKILTGGGTGSATSDSKLKQATEMFSTSDSVPAIAATLDEVKTLLSYRSKTLTRGTYLENKAPATSSGVKILSITPVPR